MPAPLARRFATVAGVRTAYLDAGAGDPVVAIHGVPTSSALFEPLLPALAGFRLLAPDLLGQGETEAPRGFLGWDRYAAHLDAFLDALAPPRFDLVVHDLGGLLGLDWAGRHPERVRRATLAILRRPGAIAPDLAERWARPWTRARVVRSFDLLAPWRVGAVRRRLAALRVPALVPWGDRDGVFPAANARPIVAALPGAELVIVPGAGHWSMLDAPDEVSAHLANFLRRDVRAASVTPTRR